MNMGSEEIIQSLLSKNLFCSSRVCDPAMLKIKGVTDPLGARILCVTEDVGVADSLRANIL
jgi:hypothetical protein